MAKKDTADQQKEKKVSAEKKRSKKSKKRQIQKFIRGRAYIKASFNNTLITLTDPDGNVIITCSPGAIGFKGSKKSTPFAATKAAEEAVARVEKYGIQEVDVYIKGPGPGRTAAVKGLDAAGLKILSLVDLTGIPHNGCRAKKQPRN